MALCLRFVLAIGLTNQRETTIVWDAENGEALAPAIVWHDTRTSGLVDTFIAKTSQKSAYAFQVGSFHFFTLLTHISCMATGDKWTFYIHLFLCLKALLATRKRASRIDSRENLSFALWHRGQLAPLSLVRGQPACHGYFQCQSNHVDEFKKGRLGSYLDILLRP